MVLYLLLLVLMTPWANDLWEQVGMLRLVQFPWRILSVTAVLQMICAAGLGRLPDWRYVRKAWVLPFLLVAAFMWHWEMRTVKGYRELDPFSRQHPLVALRDREFTTANANEFMPRTARIPEHPTARGRDRVVQAEGETLFHEVAGHSAYHINCWVGGRSGAVVINQLYFPGWRVRLGGKDLSEEDLKQALLPDGRMRVPVIVADGEWRPLEAWYDGPPGWRIHCLLVALAIGGFAWFCVRERRALAALAARPPAADWR
jgi:hypothetical protein